MMLPSAINQQFKVWDIDPTYGWDTLELSLDDPITESVESIEHLRQILTSSTQDLISMAVDETDKGWSTYFTWALHILDSKMPMTQPEMTTCLGEAARWYRSYNRPDYLYIVQAIITDRPTKAI